MNKMKRAYSLDAFRGYAILTMILSGTIASGVLPAWMYHAQVGPRSNFSFDPSIYGITWVDLVFPFFLFAMGAAFPFSIGSKYEKGTPAIHLIWSSIKRGIKLAFFAIFIQHVYPWNLGFESTYISWLVAIASFFLMFFMFMDIPVKKIKWGNYLIKLSAFVIGGVLLLNLPYANQKTFSLSYSNIIILVLANMAVFASIWYILTMKNRLVRIGILPFIMAVFLGTSTSGSWVSWIMEYSPVPWFYSFYYLKYFFIVIPGTIAGEYLKEWLTKRDNTQSVIPSRKLSYMVASVCVLLIVCNLYGLYTRQLVLNLFLTLALLFVLWFLMKKEQGVDITYWNKLFQAGCYLLLLGLFFEAYQGGIRKDDSTYSYYFVTSGLAFIALIAFSIFCDVYRCNKLARPLEMAGQNPMIAYVAPQLVVNPIIGLLGANSLLELFNQNAFLGFLRGVLITSLAIIVAVICTRLKYFWRT